MKGLSVSSLAWGGIVDSARCEWLVARGMDAVEIAPTALTGGQWPQEGDVRVLRESIKGAGLHVSGLQSLLFGRPELSLLDRKSWPQLVRRLTDCAEMGQLLEADVLVFGSPRNRLRGELREADATSLAAEFFTSVAPVMEANGVILSLEPNPPGYGADFMTTYKEVLAVVDAAASPWVRPQIDTGCLVMAGDDPAAAVRNRTPVHAHVSAPLLGALPGAGVDHADVAAALSESGYAGWVTLEILGGNLEDPGQLEDSVRWMASTYA